MASMKNSLLIGLLIGAVAAIWCMPPSQTNATEDAPHAEKATLRHTTTGDLIGYVGENEAYAWRGVPYAQPPIGALRWRAPQPPKSWQGIRTALVPASACMQADEENTLKLHSKVITADAYSKQAQYSGSEDCLYLNIRSPRPSPKDAGRKSLLPVMMYIHGGGNVSGDSSWYDGPASKLVSTQNVVVVTVNYRLKHFGFFLHPSLGSPTSTREDLSGNYGILDLIAALRWIRDNAKEFGGDPDNITIFGTSAGGQNSMALMSSPKAKGLFQRAIPMSGYTSTRDVAQATSYAGELKKQDIPAGSGEILLRLLIADGTVANREAAKRYVETASAEKIGQYLRSKSFEDVDRADAKIVEDVGTSWLSIPTRDGDVIPLDGMAGSFADRNKHNLVSVLIGATHDEDQPYVLADGQFADVISGPSGPEYRFKDKQGYRLVSEYMSLLWNADAAQDRAADLVGSQPGKVFAYQITLRNWQPWPGPDKETRGAIHSVDVPLYFGQSASTKIEPLTFRYFPPTTEDGVSDYRFLADAMMSYWAEFAYTGDPGKGRHKNLPKWEPWSPETGGQKYLTLGSVREGGIAMSSNVFGKADVLKKLASDSRFPTAGDKCQFLTRLIHYATNINCITPADYDAFDGGLCKEAKK